MVEVSASSKKKPHAVAIALPVQGHINPMMQLAIKLAARGCIVTLVNLESNHKRLARSGSDSDLDLELDIRFESIPDRVPVEVASLDIFSSEENRKTFRKAYEAMGPDVLDLLRNKLLKDHPGSIDVIIGDVYLNWVGEVADAVGMPMLLFSTTCASSLLVDYWIPRLLETGDIPIAAEDKDKEKQVAADLPGMPSPLRLADLPSYFVNTPESMSRRHAKAKALSNCDGILINSADFLEPEAFKVLQSEVNPNTVPVGPLLDTGGKSTTNAAWTTDTKCLDWLNCKAENSVLYVSFGSLATMTPEQVLEIAEGLKQCRYSVLWVLRPNLLPLNHDSSELLKAMLEELQCSGKACIVSWAPQLQVLDHAAVGGFLTHCGWNSMMEAVWFGVPVLAWPQIVEQNLVARIACGEWKIGRRMPRGVVDKVAVWRIVDEFMAAEEFGRNCRALQEVLKATSKELVLDVILS